MIYGPLLHDCSSTVSFFKNLYTIHICKIYYSLCDGGDSNRQFIKIHFPSCDPSDLHFVGYNMFTEDPMMFIMDCKVNSTITFIMQ